jgi:signal transduction histidine kinase
LCDVAELYEPVAEERGLLLKAEAKQPVFVRADRQLLGQAIANLIDNAIKYGTTKEPEVEVTATEKGKTVEIVVSDHGPGVPASERERVLDRFVRLEASRSEPGSGLGLSLVAAVARLHGGSLRLEDNAPGLKVILALPSAGEAMSNGVPAHEQAGLETKSA